MDIKTINNFELIDGKAIISDDFSIITADEILYRFIGVSTTYNFIDIIHQVNFEDFEDITTMLRAGSSKTMVVRIRRFDNSYRWVLMTIMKHEDYSQGVLRQEYIELHLTDIHVLKKQNDTLKEMLKNCAEYATIDDMDFGCCNSTQELMSKDELLCCFRNNIENNIEKDATLILIQIDNYDKMIRFGDNTSNNTFDFVCDIINDMTKDRGHIGKYDEGIIIAAVRDISEEVYIRAFLQALKGRVLWESGQNNADETITFSIGVARYPFNGIHADNIIKKAEKALAIANEKGHNRFILYKENLHGEIE